MYVFIITLCVDTFDIFPCGTLRMVLNHLSLVLKIRVEQLYPVHPGSVVKQQLRNVLSRLGVPMWCEVFAGLSWKAYHTLDVLCAYYSPTWPFSSGKVTRYQVHDTYTSGKYYLPIAEDWWKFRVWVASGQEDAFTDYGPGISLTPQFLQGCNSLGITSLGATSVLTTEQFQQLCQAHPRIFDIAFSCGMDRFMNQYWAKGKGKGKANASLPASSM